MLDYNIGEKYLDNFVSINKADYNGLNDFEEFSYFGKDHIWNPQESSQDFQEQLSIFKDWAKAINQQITVGNEDNNEEGVGDLVSDHDQVQWSPVSNENTYVKSTLVPPQYNVQKAIDVLKKNAHKESTHFCALYVRNALNAGGVTITGKGNANGYGAYFKKSKQWTEINPQDVLPGDVCFTKNSKNGHLAMWTGKQWISDYIQNGPHVYSYAKDGKNTFYYRYTG